MKDIQGKSHVQAWGWYHVYHLRSLALNRNGHGKRKDMVYETEGENYKETNR